VGTYTGQNILDRARDKANDEDTTKRWSDAKALQYINDGQIAAVGVLPSVYTLAATPTAVAGSTRQTLAGLGLTTGLTIVDVPRNIASDGATPGRAMTKRDRVWLDDHRPRWHTEMAAEAYHWCQDERDPKAVYVYPAKTAGKLEIIYSAMPPALATLASTIAVDDIYADTLQWYLLFSFYSKDATNNRGQQMAATYYGLFLQSLGVRTTALFNNALRGDARAAGN
jgi:hypothetical protein